MMNDDLMIIFNFIILKINNNNRMNRLEPRTNIYTSKQKYVFTHTHHHTILSCIVLYKYMTDVRSVVLYSNVMNMWSMMIGR